MSLVPGADAARIMGRLMRMLADTCDLYDTAAPRARTAAAVPCSVVALADPTIRSTADRGETVVVWRILLPAGTEVHPDWQIRLSETTASPALAGRVFAVTGDLPGSGERIRRVICVEAQ